MRYAAGMAAERQPSLFEVDNGPKVSEPCPSVPSHRVLRTTEDFRGAITALAPWFGSNRLLAPEVGRHLRGCEWVGIPFAGGMCEVPHIEARTLVINDVHRAVVALARVTADHVLGPKLYRRLRRRLLHPTELEDSQEHCRFLENCLESTDAEVNDSTLLAWAEHYFTAVWMARAGAAGTDNELEASLALRWNAGGGDSARRYHSAIRSLNAWRRTFRRATFSTLDVFVFLGQCKDLPKHGIYCDQPFPGPGDKYRHKFDKHETEKLANRLTQFVQARVVCRFYDHSLIRELYPPSRWSWHQLVGRKQTNDKAPEILLVRN